MSARFIIWMLSGAALLAATLAGVSTWNHLRLEASALDGQMEALIARASLVRENARPDYQLQVLRSLPSNPFNGMVFRLDDQLDRAVVASEQIPAASPDGLELVFSYEFDDGPGLMAVGKRSSVAVEDGILVVDHDETDYLVNDSEIDIPKDDVGEIEIRVRARRGKHLRLAWSAELNPENPWINRIDIPIAADGEFHTYTVNAKNAMKGGEGRGLVTGDHLRRLYLKPSDLDGDRVEIDSIRFISKRSKYLRKPRGVTHETIAKEMRQILYMLPAQQLTYSLRLPAERPTLSFGTAILIDDEPVTFSIRIAADDSEETIFESTLDSAAQWNDAKLDLSAWADRDIRLFISVAGSPENVAFWSNPLISDRPPRPFNVIVLLEDTLRADHLSTHGYEIPTAPFKDRLMERHGAVFLNAVSQATKTRPSVPSLMTSLLPTATGVWDFADMLSDEYLTLAEIMRQQGFATASFIQNANAGPLAGAHQGFSTLFDAETMGTSTEQILGDRLISWIQKHRDRNFFLYVHVIDPHGVYEPPKPFDEWYRDMAPGATREEFDDHLDPEWMREPTLEGRRILYDGEIRHNDSVIEDLVETLRRIDLFEDTFLIFTADHGEHLGERGQWEHDPPGYLQVTGVPLMFVYPRRFEGGKRITENVQLIDVMPTVLDLAEVDIAEIVMQGDSLVDLVEGRQLSAWRDRVTLSEEPVVMDKARPWRNRGLRVSGSFFYRDWHFIASRRFWPERGYWPESFRMKVFDVSDDRAEARALWSFVPDLYLRFKFTRFLNRVQANNIEAWKKWTGGGSRDYKFDPDVLERLEALGYAQ